MNDWHPLNTWTLSKPPAVGALIAREHAVWRVTAVTNLALTADERDRWIDYGMPDLDTWPKRPYRLALEHVGGFLPEWAKPHASIDNRVGAVWNVYRDGRWPMCSCCGEPMPCRSELQDREITRSLNTVAKWESRKPGDCWGCGEEITSRQKTVTYPGDNLDLPGAAAPRFHTRRYCVGAAKRYEERWIALDPRRERILTWPQCGGMLMVHADGSSQCVSGRGPLGFHHQGQHDCQGHDTHNHTSKAACYVLDWWDCPRGCSPRGHRGAHPKPRPPRRQNSLI